MTGDVPSKLNEVIDRTNALTFFSQNIATIQQYIPALTVSFPIIYPSSGPTAKNIAGDGNGIPAAWGGGQYDGANTLVAALAYVNSVAPNAVCAAWSGSPTGGGGGRINWYGNFTGGGQLSLVDGPGWVAIQLAAGLPGGA